MGSFLQQVFNLLTTETGGLTYHLVLAFSIFGALQAALAYWRYNFPQCRRMVTGLSLLLLFRLVLFVASGMAWQGLIDPRLILPSLDRAMHLVSLVVIIWLWAFPDTNRDADTATLLLGLIILSLAVFGIGWFNENAGQIAFGESRLELGSDALSILLILVGIVLLIRRRTFGWGTGITMLVLWLLGPLAHLISPSQGVDYPGEIRLAQMAAYPLLLALPQRLASQALSPAPSAGVARLDRRRYGADPLVAQSLLRLNAGMEPGELGQSIVEAVARAIQADICLLLGPPDETGHVAFRSGYDLVREKPVPAIRLESRQVPVLAAALSRGKGLRLPANSATPDLPVLQKALNLNQLGHFLAVPISRQNGNGKSSSPISSQDAPALGELVVITPYSGRAWTTEDETYLAEIAHQLAHILLLNQSSKTTHAVQEPQPAPPGSFQALREERDALRADLDQIKLHAEKDRSHLVTLAAMVAEQEVLRRNFAALTVENERLKLAAGEATPQNADELNPYEGELRLALEEIAFLKDALQQVDQKMLSVQASSSGSTLTLEQLDLVTSIAQELRQPMASIAGYSDFLLGESVGLLGSMQRKFLERIKTSIARMTRLVDDLVQLTAVDARLQQAQQVEVDLKEVVGNAIGSISDQLNEKKIDLQVRLPEQLPHLKIDPDVLQKILIHLLHNAGTVTPESGGVMLQAQVESTDGAPDYLLIRVADSGGGISRENMPNLFSRTYRSEHPTIPGLGDAGVGLAIVKSLVESQGGRVWADTDMGRGSIFSVLLPVVASNSRSPNGSKWGTG